MNRRSKIAMAMDKVRVGTDTFIDSYTGYSYESSIREVQRKHSEIDTREDRNSVISGYNQGIYETLLRSSEVELIKGKIFTIFGGSITAISDQLLHNRRIGDYSALAVVYGLYKIVNGFRQRSKADDLKEDMKSQSPSEVFNTKTIVMTGKPINLG